MSLQLSKCDAELGLVIHKLLIEKGVETPLVSEKIQISDLNKIQVIEKNITEIMTTLGLNLLDDSLKETHIRVAKMYINEIFWGLKTEHFPNCTVIDNKMQYDEMVVEKNIVVTSNCEHHLVPIEGKAHVAYIPNKKIIGLSKINRVVEYFSRRPQVQERLTEQVFYALSHILDTENVAVVIEASHSCVKMRGVEDSGSLTVTAKLGGYFKNTPETRTEFMALIK